MQSSELQQNTSLIPTHIITGFLGTGKTTAINHLISQKPAHEKWAVIINEFGQIGVDQTAIPTQDDIHIKEIAGGCVCCALGPALTINLAMLIRRIQPDRILIEPTGLGHPSGLIDIIQGESFCSVLSLHSVICLLDPRAMDDPRTTSHETFIDQLNLADYIVLNKTDVASDTQLDQALKLAENMYPPKQAILKMAYGKVPIEVLNTQHIDEFSASFPLSHEAEQTRSLLVTPPLQPLMLTEPGKPIMKTGFSNDIYSCGWVFHRDDIFDYEALLTLINSISPVLRLKGVFRTSKDRVFFNNVSGELSITPIAWRRDSRMEILSQTKLDWAYIEEQLLRSLAGKSHNE